MVQDTTTPTTAQNVSHVTEQERKDTMRRRCEIKDLVGLTVKRIEYSENTEVLEIETDQGTFKMFHNQDCCEHVYLAEVTGGSLEDLVGQKIVDANENISDEEDTGYEYLQWTFYDIKTELQTITLRWLGSSNGYYSVNVDLYRNED